MDQTQQIRELRAEVSELRTELRRLDWWQQMLPLKVMTFAIYLLSAGVIAALFLTIP